MSKTQDIIEVMQSYEQGVPSSTYSDPRDSNHWIRRFFRCWIDGSYNGESHYRANLEYIRKNQNNEKRMRSFVISEFTQFIAKEHDCSYSTAQKAIVKSLTSNELEALNKELIDDALDLLE